MDRIAPNIADRMFLLRPVMAEPTLCDIVDIRTRLTLDDVADLHEILDIKEALLAKGEEQRERESRRKTMG